MDRKSAAGWSRVILRVRASGAARPEMRLAFPAANRLVPAMRSAYCCPYEGLCLS